MKCVDATFCIDLANGAPGAVSKAEELSALGQRLAIPAPALTEFLVGAFHQGGRRLVQALELAAQLEVLETTDAIATDAARVGGDCTRRGEPVGTMDLLIAATARHHHAHLLTRDSDFARIPGVVLETY
jgi:tRNA(fMet)-specific endonuclease VapC